MALCVYALSSPGVGTLSATGIAGERLRAIPVGSIFAIVGEMPRVPRPTEASLRRYDRIMKALSRRTSALLPARYGTHVRDLYELALILGARQETLRRRLKAVRNRVQMTVRVMDRSAAPAVVRPTRDKNEKTGADYLRARAREAALARDVPGFDPLRAAVRRWVRDERVEKRGAVTSVYHLVPRGSVEAYRKTLDAQARAAGVRLVISGPWPAYAFADTW